MKAVSRPQLPVKPRLLHLEVCARWRLARRFDACALHAARRASDRKRKETNRMAEFMQGAVARTNRRRKDAGESEPSADPESTTTSTRSEAELAFACCSVYTSTTI